MIKEISILYKRKMRDTIRQPVWVVMGLTTPLLYLLLFSPLLHNAGAVTLTTKQILDSFVPGLLTLLAFTAGMGSGWDVVADLQSGVVERLRVTPAHRFSIMLGSVLHDITMFLIPAVIVLIISACFGFEVHVGGLVVQLVMLCFLTAIVSAWSASIGLIVKENGSVAAVMTGMQLPLTLLAGVLLPISYGPMWLQILAHINPMYYAVEASRSLASGVISASAVWIAFVVLVPLCVLVLWWATRVYKKAIK